MTPRRAFTLVVRIFAAFFVMAAAFRIIDRAVAPSGILATSTDLTRPAPFVLLPKPADRVDVESADGALIKASPVYVDLAPPSPFDEVTMRVTYANPAARQVSIGALASTVDGAFAMRPVEQPLLDSLGWSRVTDGRVTVYQRRHAYDSVAAFFAHPPDMARIAEFNAGETVAVAPPADASGGERRITPSLRGSHRMFTVTTGEKLAFIFVFQDMNREIGADPAVITVTRERDGRQMLRSILHDDGNAADDQRSSKLRELSVETAAPEPGVYRIDVATSDDVFIREIRTPQRKLVFAGRLFFGDYVGYSDVVPSAIAYADGHRVEALVPHPENLQKIDVGGRIIDAFSPNARVAVPVSGGIVQIAAPRRDVILATDGVFALAEAEYFRPRPRPLAWYTSAANLDRDGTDFVIADYAPPRESGASRSAEATFRTQDLARAKNGAYRFAIQVDGIAEGQGDAVIRNVTFILRRERLSWREALAAFIGMRKSAPKTMLVPKNGVVFGETME